MTGARPACSIVVPCFNYGALVPETIESVLAQTVSDWELLVVNDGSRDETQAVLERYAKQDGRIRVLRLPSNVGIPAARNLGTAATTGRHLMHLDADDILSETALEMHLDALQSVDVSCVGYSSFDRSPSEPLATYLEDIPDDALVAMLTIGPDQPRWWVPPGAVMVRREADAVARQRFEVWPRQVQTLTESHYYACLYRSGASFSTTKRVGLCYRKHAASDGATASFISLGISYLWIMEFWLRELGQDHAGLLRRKANLLQTMRIAMNVETEFAVRRASA